MTHIEDYALLSDLQTAALVSRDGSVDWLCFPRFDSGACFAALLGTPDHGRWLLAPRDEAWHAGWRYRPETLVLETEWETDSGVVRVGLTWYPSNEDPPERVDADTALEDTVQLWEGWTERCTYRGEWREAVQQSLVVLKALTYAPTGGIVAAPTTSLPEQLGGVRNWDYRFCWLRDATLTLLAFLNSGYLDEA